MLKQKHILISDEAKKDFDNIYKFVKKNGLIGNKREWADIAISLLKEKYINDNRTEVMK